MSKAGIGSRLHFEVLGDRILGRMIKSEGYCYYKATFGVDQITTSALWKKLIHHKLLVGDAMCPEHLLWALYFLKTYPNGRTMACTLGADRGTVMSTIRFVINKIAKLRKIVVSKFLF